MPLSKDTSKPRNRRQNPGLPPRTIPIHRISKRERRHLQLLEELDPIEYERPRTRADCERGIRPCPFVSCVHNLYLDIQPRTGAIKINFPDLEPDQLPETCALDVADNGGITLDAVGRVMNITRERIRQISALIMRKIGRDLAKLR